MTARTGEEPQSVRAALAAPWSSGNGLWVGLAILLVWTVVGGVLLALDLEEFDSYAHVDVWIWGLIVGPWLVFLVRYAMLCVSPPPPPTDQYAPSVDDELWRECFSMAHFALERGKTPEANDLEVIQRYGTASSRKNNYKNRMEELTEAHKRLSRLVSPAMPKTLVLLRNPDVHTDDPTAKRRDDFAWLGNVRVAKAMLALAAGLLPVFIALALSKGTTLESAGGLFQGNSIDKALTAIYLIVASALGASFAGLFKVRRYVENLSYDDQYESSYWVRFVLGLVAGLILSVVLASLLPVGNEGQEQEFRITLPILALVGGFSSDLVYRILKRLIDAIETLVEGSAGEIKEAATLRMEARLKEQEIEVEQHRNEMVLTAEKQEIAAVIAMINEIPEDGAANAVRAKLNQRLVALVAEDQEPAEDQNQTEAQKEAEAQA